MTYTSLKVGQLVSFNVGCQEIHPPGKGWPLALLAVTIYTVIMFAILLGSIFPTTIDSSEENY